MDYYSALKWNDVLMHTTTWGNLENTRLSENAGYENFTSCIIPTIEMPRIGKFTETQNSFVLLGLQQVEGMGGTI